MHSISNNRSHLDTQLNRLESCLLDLSSMVEKAIDQSLMALANRNHRQAEQVIVGDRQLNARRYEIEDDALSVLALQQPVVSRDLRYIAAVMHIAGELERMGDYAKGIARISSMLPSPPPTQILLQLQQMATQSNSMLHRAMDALVEHSATNADKVAADDDILDDLYNQVYRQLLDLMLTDHSTIDLATLLLWAAHNLERMGDRATNICERIRFVETGVLSDSPGHHHASAK